MNQHDEEAEVEVQLNLVTFHLRLLFVLSYIKHVRTILNELNEIVRDRGSRFKETHSQRGGGGGVQNAIFLRKTYRNPFMFIFQHMYF